MLNAQQPFDLWEAAQKLKSDVARIQPLGATYQMMNLTQSAGYQGEQATEKEFAQFLRIL